MLICFAGVSVAALDISLVGPGLPAIQVAFGVDERAISQTFTLYVLFNLVGTPGTAKLAERYGRRPVFAASLVLFALGSLAVAAAPSFEALCAARGLVGFAASALLPIATASIGDAFPPEQRGRGLGLLGIVYGLAFVLGPVSAGFLLAGSWRVLFLLTPPLALLAAVLSARVLPASPGETKPFDHLGLGLLATGLAALTLAFQHLDTAAVGASLRSVAVWPFALAAGVLLPLFWRREHRAADPILRPGMLQSRAARLACAFAFGSGMGEAGLVFMPGLAICALAVSKAQASFLLLPVVLAVGVGAPISGWAHDRFGGRPVILSGLLLVGAGLGVLSKLAATRLGFHGGGVLLGLGLTTLLGAPVRAIFLAVAGPGERVASQAAFNVFANAGRLSSAALVGAITSSSGGGLPGYQRAYGALAGILFGLAALSLAMPRRSLAQPPAVSA